MIAAVLAAAAPLPAADRDPAARCLSPEAGTDAVEPCQAAERLALPPVRSRNVRLALARALVRHQRYADAIQAYRDAARQMPEDAETRLCVGIALLHVGTDPEGAIDELQVALRLDPGSARGYGALGSALHALGEYPESAAAFAEAARLDPEFLANRPATQALEEASRRGEAWPAVALP